MRRDRGFTLTEVLVVIGIITIVAFIAVPAFRAMTGSRSTEAAQNIISSVLARARTEALGLQEPRGVMFYRDIDTQRIGMALIKPINTAPPYELDLVADRDPVLLPPGVGIQFIDDDIPAVTGDEDRYIGFNTRINRANDTNATVVPYGGVVLFDGKGQLTTDAYAFAIRYERGLPSGATELRWTEMRRFLYNDPSNGIAPAGPMALTPNPVTPAAKVGFVLFDGEAFTNAFREGRAGGVTEEQDSQADGRVTFGTKTDVPPEEAAEEDWLNQNATPVLVNRYNATLLRGE